MNRERIVTLIRGRLIFVKIATVLLWVSWLVSISFSGFRRDIEDKPIGTDHIAFYSAAKLIDEGQGNRIYDYDFLGQYQSKLTGHGNWYLDAYRNPPFYALLYLPTSRLPYLASFWTWTAVSLAMLWFGLSWLGSEQRFAAFVMALSFYPVFSLFGFGQNSLLSFGFLCLTFQMMERRRFFLAGLAAGMMLYKPQLLFGLGLWWLLSCRQYWRCLLGLSAMGLFWLIVSFVFVPTETRIFVDRLSYIAGYDAFMFWNLHNPRGFFTLISFDDKTIGSRAGAICSIAAIVLFVLFWRKRKNDMPLMFAAAVFLTLWASPHTMIYEWSIAVLPAALLWDRVKEKRDEWLVIFSIAWIAMFVSTPIAKGLFEWTQDPKTGSGWAIQISVPVMAALAIWAGRVLSSVGKGRAD